MENHADTIAEKRAASNTSENETEPCNVDCNALLPVPAKKRKKQRKEIIETPFYLPGETDAPMTPEERRKELHEMMHPHTPELEEAAKLLGIQLD